MSNVRVSNGSPTLERMEGRPADYPKPSACRSLFGPVDHHELARELQRHSRDLEEASRRKWNFDFHRCQPLDGRYEWQPVSKDALPEFYSRPPRLTRPRAAGPRRHPDGHGGSSSSSSSPSPSPPPAGWRRRAQGTAGRGEEEEDDDEDAEEGDAAAAAKTEAAGARADLAAQQSSGGQKKRPASDDSFPPNKRANMTEEAISESPPSASSVEQTPKKSSPRKRQT